MRRAPPHGDGWQRQILHRFERSSEDLNPILLLIVIGLAILDFSVFAALELSRLPLRPARASQIERDAPPLAQSAIVRLPQS